MVEKAEKKKRRKILVTGSSGMLGSALSAELRGTNEVIGLDKRAPKQCDITDRKNTENVILSAKPDLIIHAAAWTDVDGCERDPDRASRINALGTENVALPASRLDIPLVYISTDFVFDGRKGAPYTEEDLPNPLNAYAKSKLEGEKAVGKLNKYIILRTSWLFGVKGRNFVDAILNAAKKKKKLEVVDDQVGSPTYAGDLAKAINVLLEITLRRTTDECEASPQGDGRRTKEIYHVSNRGTVSRFDYAREILKLAGIPGVSVTPVKTSRVKMPTERPAFSALDNSKFEKATGFTMRPWHEALAEYLRHPMLPHGECT
jgi:dTDP-4-dehydrorhamnose reductase